MAACCRYRVERQPVLALRGAVPAFVNGTLYHAVFVTNLTDDYPGAGTVGALLSVDFAPTPPLASFRYNEGTKFATMCNATPPERWAPSNAVTINRVNRSALVVASAVPHLVNRFSARTLAPLNACPTPLRLGSTDDGVSFSRAADVTTDVKPERLGWVVRGRHELGLDNLTGGKHRIHVRAWQAAAALASHAASDTGNGLKAKQTSKRR